MRWIVAFLLLSSTALVADEYQLLHFGATWCVHCGELEKRLDDKDVKALIKKGDIKRVDIDVDQDPDGAAKYKVTALPVCILVRVNDKQEAVVVRRVTGAVSKEQLVKLVTLPQSQD